MLSYDEALAAVLLRAIPLDVVSMPLGETCGRYLAQDIVSKCDVPAFDNSQMDGYAVKSADIVAASTHNTVELTVVGTAAAGKPDVILVGDGDAVRIFTGAPIPIGADCVVPVEDVEVGTGGHSVAFVEPAGANQFIRRRAEDVSAGQVVIRSGRRIHAGDMALIASAGHGSVSVTRQARVAILTNGDELVQPGDVQQELKHGQIYESNALMLAAMATLAGAKVVGQFFAADSRTALREQFLRIIEEEAADVIVSTGGVSVGDRDYVRSVVEELGEIVFWRAAIRPGKPIVYGRFGSSHFLGLPGNPASTMVTFDVFARPLLNILMGGRGGHRFWPTRLGRTVSHDPGRRSFVRATTQLTSSGLISTPLVGQGSHYITSLANANSLIVVPEDRSEIPAGAEGECLLLGHFLDE